MCPSPFRKYLPRVTETLAIEYSGRRDRRKESFADRVSDLAEFVGGALVNFVADKTFRLIGPGLPLARDIAHALVVQVRESRGMSNVGIQ